MKKLTTKLATLALATSMAAAPTYADQGVTDTEILIGSNNDLSGPFAAFGAPAVQAAQLVFDEVNAAGGIYGRTIRFIVEDHGYQMPRAIQEQAGQRRQGFCDAPVTRHAHEPGCLQIARLNERAKRLATFSSP